MRVNFVLFLVKNISGLAFSSSTKLKYLAQIFKASCILPPSPSATKISHNRKSRENYAKVYTAKTPIIRSYVELFFQCISVFYFSLQLASHAIVVQGLIRICKGLPNTCIRQVSFPYRRLPRKTEPRRWKRAVD